jgi:hypothetical protein
MKTKQPNKNITLTYETTRGTIKTISGLVRNAYSYTDHFYYTKGEGDNKMFYSISSVVKAKNVYARHHRNVGYVISFNDYQDGEKTK